MTVKSYAMSVAMSRGVLSVSVRQASRRLRLIALMVYAFARVGAALGMKVGDVYAQGGRLWVRLREEGWQGARWLRGALHPAPPSSPSEYVAFVRDLANARPRSPAKRTRSGRKGARVGLA